MHIADKNCILVSERHILCSPERNNLLGCTIEWMG